MNSYANDFTKTVQTYYKNLKKNNCVLSKFYLFRKFLDEIMDMQRIILQSLYVLKIKPIRLTI